MPRQGSPNGGRKQVGAFALHRPVDLPGIEIWRSRSFEPSSMAVFPGYVLSTVGPAQWPTTYSRLNVRGKIHDLRGGDVALLEAGDACLVQRVTTGIEVSNLVVDPSWMEREILGNDGPVPHGQFSLATVRDESMSRMLAAFCEELSSQPMTPLEKEERLRALLIRAFSHCKDQKMLKPSVGCSRAVARARHLIEDSFASPLSLTELARECGLSKFYLGRSFSAYFGVPMHRFQTMIRLRRAMEFMRQGLRPADVAIRTGFTDQAHLHKTFVQNLGFTPGTYYRAGRR